MFKTLLRKNMLEVSQLYFRDKKKGGKLSGGGKVGMIVLYIFLYVVLAASFGAMSSLFFISGNESTTWIAWAIMGLIAIAVSTIINALTSYSQLYLAKDNEMLLSMPISPGDILKSRMVSVYLMGLVYVSMVWLPTLVAGIVIGSVPGLLIAPAIVMMLILGVIVLALTCFLGWVVAVLATKFKNQKILWTIVTFLFLAGLYYFQFKSNKLFTMIAENMEHVGDVIQAKLWPFYMIGHATDGNSFAYGVVCIIALALAALAYMLLTKTFIKVATTKTAGNNAKFSESQIKSLSVKKALRKKEWGRFFGSVTCMMNIGLAVVIMIAAAVFFFVKGDMIAGKLMPIMEALPIIKLLMPLAVVMVIAMIESMACMSSSSISLEGKNIWMMQTLPVNAEDILRAKVDVSIEFQGFPAILLAWAMAESLGMELIQLTAVVFFGAAYASLSSNFGMMLNLKHNRLDWTSETTVVKQGMAVVLTLFGGWLFGMVIAALGYLLRNTMNPALFIVILDVVMYIAAMIIEKWIKHEGAEIYRYLS